MAKTAFRAPYQQATFSLEWSVRHTEIKGIVTFTDDIYHGCSVWLRLNDKTIKICSH